MTHVRLSRLLGRGRLALLPLALLGLAVSATYVGQAVATATVFGRALDDGVELTELRGPLLVLAALLALRPALVLVRELVAVRVMTSVKTRLRAQVGGQLLAESARDVGRGRTGHDGATLVDGVENLDLYLMRYLPSALTTGLVLVGVGAALVVVDPVVGAVVAAAAVLLPLVPRLWDRVLARRGAEHWDAYQDLHAEFVDSMQGMTTLVLHDAADRRQAELAAASATLLRRTLGQLRISLLESGLNTFALNAVPLVALVVATARRDVLSAGETFAVVLLSIELVRPLRDLAAQWHAGYLGTFSGRQLLDVLDRRDAPGDARDGLSVASVESVDLAGVTVRHPGATTPAVVDVSLTAGPGLTAVVGSSGSGKSTLVAALAGLLDVESGTVTVGGRVSGPERLDLVALVPQDPVLFAGTVAENLQVGAPAGWGDADADVEASARLAGIGTDDPSLTLTTPVGERGGLVSGGQRQRIAVARALLQDRPVLVLDEATSALDVASERALLDRLRRHQAGRPLVVVAHRTASVDDADQVVVMAAGRVVEAGPPHVLISAEGAFSRLVDAAAAVAR